MRQRRIPELTDFDLKLLRVFSAVADAGGFSAAEVSLNKSKSSISVDIASLEVRLGVKLCRRGRGGFALTAEGEEVLALSRDLFDSVSRFREGASRVSMKMTGELVLVMDDNFPFAQRDQLTRIVSKFHNYHPDVFLNLRSSSPERVTQMILDGTADVGISASPPDIAGTKTYPLFEEPMMLCCGAKHPLYSKPVGELTLESVREFDCVDIVTRQNHKSRDIINQMHVTARAATINARSVLILSGAYIGFLPSNYVSYFSKKKLLKPILVEKLSFVNVCSVIVRNEVFHSLSCQVLLDLIRENFNSASIESPAAVNA